MRGTRACECGRTHVPNIKSLPHPHKILRRSYSGAREQPERELLSRFTEPLLGNCGEGSLLVKLVQRT